MEYCKICMKKVVDKKNELCPQCNRKRLGANYTLELSKKIDFNNKLYEKDLIKIGMKNKIKRNDCIWSLVENNLVKKEKNHYIWENEEKLQQFTEKYGDSSLETLQGNIEIQKTNVKNCEMCGKEITNLKKSKYCKKCKKINKTLENISKIESIIPKNTYYSFDDLAEKTGTEYLKIQGIIWDLQENDLVEMNESEEYLLLEDKINEFKEKHSKTSKKEDIEKNEEIKNKPIIPETKNDDLKETTTKQSLKENNNIEKQPMSRLARNFIKITLKNKQEKRPQTITSEYEKTNEEKIKTDQVISKDEINNDSEDTQDNTKIQINNSKMDTSITDTKDNIEIKKIKTNDDLLDISKKIYEYLKDYVTVLDRSIVKDTDVTSTEIFNDFNMYLKDKYNEQLNEEHIFINYFTTELFKMYPRAYRSIRKDEKEDIIRFNIEIKYHTKTSDIIYEEEVNSISEDQRKIIEEYIENCLEIKEKNPTAFDHTFNDIYNIFTEYIADKDVEISEQEFSKIFNSMQESYGIKYKLLLGKNRYNVEIKKVKTNNTDIKSSDTSKKQISNKIDNEKTLINTKEETNTAKQIPPKIFVATFDENIIFFLKTRILKDNFNNLLKLLEKTSEKLSSSIIKRLDDESLDVSLEYTVKYNEKEEYMKIIQEYSWD